MSNDSGSAVGGQKAQATNAKALPPAGGHGHRRRNAARPPATAGSQITADEATERPPPRIIPPCCVPADPARRGMPAVTARLTSQRTPALRAILPRPARLRTLLLFIDVILHGPRVRVRPRRPTLWRTPGPPDDAAQPRVALLDAQAFSPVSGPFAFVWNPSIPHDAAQDSL